MRARRLLAVPVLLAAVAGCDGMPASDQPPAITPGEEIISAFVAGAAADGRPPPRQLSEVGILAGSWDYLTDSAMAAEIERYAEDSGTIVVCPPPVAIVTTPDGTVRSGGRSGECRGDPTWGLLEFGVLGADPSDLSAQIHWPTSDAWSRPSLYHMTATPLETGGWRLSAMGSYGRHSAGITFRYVPVAESKDGGRS